MPAQAVTLGSFTARWAVSAAREVAMSVSRRFAAVLSLSMLFVVAWPGGAPLQGESLATVSGIVVDPDGRPLPGTRVTLAGEGVAPTTVLTNGAGKFRFPAVNPTHVYSISAELPGYKSITYEGMEPE